MSHALISKTIIRISMISVGRESRKVWADGMVCVIWSAHIVVSRKGIPNTLQRPSTPRQTWLWIAIACLTAPLLHGASAELKVELGHSKSIGSVAISRDSRWVLTGSDDGSARLWDVA